jgi:hypothetical protein
MPQRRKNAMLRTAMWPIFQADVTDGLEALAVDLARGKGHGLASMSFSPRIASE